MSTIRIVCGIRTEMDAPKFKLKILRLNTTKMLDLQINHYRVDCFEKASSTWPGIEWLLMVPERPLFEPHTYRQIDVKSIHLAYIFDTLQYTTHNTQLPLPSPSPSPSILNSYTRRIAFPIHYKVIKINYGHTEIFYFP